MNYESMGSAKGVAVGIFKSGVNLITSIPAAIHKRQLAQQAKIEDTIAQRSLSMDAGQILSYEKDIAAGKRDVNILETRKRNVLIGTVATVAVLGAVGYVMFSN